MYIATIFGLFVVWLIYWLRFRDPFHPLTLLLPQFAFLYGYMPFELRSSDPVLFNYYSGGEIIYIYQGATLLLITCLAIGVEVSTRNITRASARWQMLHIRGGSSLVVTGAVLGILGLSAFLYIVYSSGGFLGAYGAAYGGGSVSSGYIREMRFLGLGGALIIYAARAGHRLRPIDWALIAVCVSPTLLHALLGARRGPAFLALMVLVGGYIYFTRKRVRLIMLMSAGLAVGLLMLFLVINRSSIYIGSEASDFRSPLEQILRWESNEYLIGNAVFDYAQTYGAFYGARELIWISARLVPKAVWPSIWQDLPQMLGVDVDITTNGGVSQQAITTIANWTPSIGSAEGFTGSLWLEFGIFAPIAAFAIGVLYGSFWSKARYVVTLRVLYLLTAALSVYLVMQSLDPWLYRLILFGIPVWIVLRNFKSYPVIPINQWRQLEDGNANYSIRERTTRG